MHQDAQQHHRISAKTTVLAQQAKEAATCKINDMESGKAHEQISKSES